MDAIAELADELYSENLYFFSLFFFCFKNQYMILLIIAVAIDYIVFLVKLLLDVVDI